jgi:hypothetical protein
MQIRLPSSSQVGLATPFTRFLLPNEFGHLNWRLAAILLRSQAVPRQ